MISDDDSFYSNHSQRKKSYIYIYILQIGDFSIFICQNKLK